MDNKPKTTSSADNEQTGSAPAGDYSEEARIFYARLEEAGQLKDVGFDFDPAQLPPSITHVRLPDGTVQRVGFS